MENPDLSDFKGAETLELMSQVKFYTKKYVRVGTLSGWVPPPESAYEDAKRVKKERKKLEK